MQQMSCFLVPWEGSSGPAGGCQHRVPLGEAQPWAPGPSQRGCLGWGLCWKGGDTTEELIAAPWGPEGWFWQEQGLSWVLSSLPGGSWLPHPSPREQGGLRLSPEEPPGFGLTLCSSNKTVLGAVCSNKAGGYNASVPRCTFHLEGFPRSFTHAVCRSLPGAQGAVGEGCSLILAACVPLLLLTQGPGWRLV